jgi:hypothetical protein
MSLPRFTAKTSLGPKVGRYRSRARASRSRLVSPAHIECNGTCICQGFLDCVEMNDHLCGAAGVQICTDVGTDHLTCGCVHH